MKTIIAGSRDINSYISLLKAIQESGIIPTIIVSGKAQGADTLGELYAKRHRIMVDPYPAQWEDLSHYNAVIKINKNGVKYDAMAGRRRNRQMAENAEALIALWDGKSKGTKNMIDIAKELNLKVFVYYV